MTRATMWICCAVLLLLTAPGCKRQSALSVLESTPAAPAKAAAPAAVTPQPPPPEVAVPAVDDRAVQLPTPGSVAQPFLPPPAVLLLISDSSRHRSLFNRVAGEYYPFRWGSDAESPHQLDVAKGELVLPEALRSQFGLQGLGWSETPALHIAIRFVEQELDRRRREAMKSLLKAQQPVTFRFAVSQLSPPAQAAMRPLLEAAQYIQTLFQVQLMPEAPQLISEIYRRAEPLELALLRRNGAPHCGRLSDNEYCDLLPSFPGVRPAAAMWPEGMSRELFTQLKQQAADVGQDPRLSPFTLTTRNPDGGFGWIPYAQSEPFLAGSERVAALLEEAAQVPGLDPTFQQQLVAQAAAFRSTEAYPFAASDAAWAEATGELELTIGPYETYRDPWDTKAYFQYVLGRERPQAASFVQRIFPRLSSWEQGVAALNGADGYTARTLPERVPFRVIDVILATGDANSDGGPPVAYHLPNVGPLSASGGGKRVILANHLEAKFPHVISSAAVALAPALQNGVQLEAALRNVILHEIFHGIGPRVDLPITTAISERKGLTVGLALEDYAAPLEEAKADVGGQWALADLQQQGMLTPEEVRASYTTKLAGLFRQLRLGLHEAHARGAVLQFGYLFSKGAILIEGDRFALDLNKVPEAYASLLKEIVRAQVTGDLAAAKGLLDGYAAKLPPLVGQVVERMKAANIPDGIAAYYEIEE
ncbi:MAG: hypothetical protein HY696_03615 [Deltaproteobacteria bacterium]|nr:hypothetical protein [Deltaproteobacteria bacterium]